MGGSGDGGGGAAEKPVAPQCPSPDAPAVAGGDDVSIAAAAAGARRPFTSLSQEEADLALARVLQEQEQAYMMLSVYGGDYDYDDEDGEEGEGLEEDDDEESEYEEVSDAEAAELELELARREDDEAYARSLQQDDEERDVAGRLRALAGIGDWRAMDHDGDAGVDDDEDGDHTQDEWNGVDPDEYSYEELIALGEVVGTESRGLSADTLASLPSVTYHAQDKQKDNMEQCVICCVEFEEGESLVALPCKHSYHSECINQWLHLNKVCPMCNAEISTSDKSQA